MIYPDIQINAFNTSEVGLLHFPSMANWACQHPYWYTFISIHLLFGLAILVNHLWRIEKIIPKSSILPALSIVIVSSLIPAGFLLSINYFVFILIMAVMMMIFSANVQAGANARLFKAGAIMGCIVMIKPVLILVAISLIIVIAVVKSIDGRSVLAYIFGCIIPVYLFASVLWLLAPNILQKIRKINFEVPNQVVNIESLLLSFIAIIWFIVHAYFIKQNKSEIGGIQVLKKWLSLRVLWVAILICSVFSNVLPSYSFFLWINLSALLLFQCFNIVLNKKWANFTFMILILAILVNEYVFS